MNFGQSISHCFSNYFNFNGRSSRSEFWWFELFAVGLSILGSVWDASMGDTSGSGMMYLLFTAATFFPIIAVGARRLHDVGKSGWWQLISLTGIGVILLIAWWASKPISGSYSKKIKTEKTSSKSKLAEELRELKELYNDGTLSKEEFTKAKNKLLK